MKRSDFDELATATLVVTGIIISGVALFCAVVALINR